MNKMMGLCMIFILVQACGNSQKKEIISEYIDEDFQFPFSLNEPSSMFELDSKLKEISGLTYSNMSNTLLTINDEEGIMYVLDPSDGTIKESVEFGKSKDYEGIASEDGYVYITESNGNIKVIKEASHTKISKFNDRLSAENDVEGLCYDPFTQTMLIAAKGDSQTEGNDKSTKAIFTMNKNNGAIRKSPFLKINLKESIKTLKPVINSTNEIPVAKLEKRMKKFAPSGISVQPSTGLIFILSSPAKLLTVVDREGDVKAVILLDEKIHNQPEGITFDDNGNLYISNEGKFGSAKLYKYTLVK